MFDTFEEEELMRRRSLSLSVECLEGRRLLSAMGDDDPAPPDEVMQVLYGPVDSPTIDDLIEELQNEMPNGPQAFAPDPEEAPDPAPTGPVLREINPAF